MESVFQRSTNFAELAGNMIGLNEILVPSLTADAVLWSLAYEIWFYVLAGTVGYIISRGPNIASLAVLAICVAVFSVMQVENLLFWLLGAMASLAKDIRFKPVLLVIGICLVAIGTTSFALSSDSVSIVPVTFMPPVVAVFLLCLGIAMTLPFLASTPVNRSLSGIRRFSVAISSFSYTVYLFHRPVDAVLGAVFGRADFISIQTLSVYLLRIVICLAAAVFFYWCFERNTAAGRKYLHGIIAKPAIA